MSGITTHVLDTSIGKPASGVPVILEIHSGEGWKLLGEGLTDADGRLRTLLPPDTPLQAETYRLTFDTGTYFAAREVDAFFPVATIVFTIPDVAAHYHVPLLLSPFGYSTYRGS